VELDKPFRGSEAVARGLVSKARLRGPDFVTLGHDVYVAAGTVVDLPGEARAAVLRHPDGVVTGTAAAALLGADEAVADVGRTGAPIELLVPGAGVRSRGGVVVRQAALPPDEVVTLPGGEGLRTTAPARTILEVARRLSTVDAVVVADALCRRSGIGAAEVIALADRHTGERGIARVRAAAALIDPRSDTPRRTRVRIGVRLARLAAPQAGVLVRAPGTGEVLGALDLAWPDRRAGALVDRHPEIAWYCAEALEARGWDVVCLGDRGADTVEHVVSRVDALLARVARRDWRDVPDLRGRVPRRPAAPRTYPGVGAAAVAGARSTVRRMGDVDHTQAS
jgi:hypothetical protein